MVDATLVKLRLLRDSDQPPSGDGSPVRFGLQDSKGGIHAGRRRADGIFAFDFELTVKPGADPLKPVFTGAFASGPRDERFVYLAWQRTDGDGYVNRIKARLVDIDWSLVRAAQAAGRPLEADLSGRKAGGGQVSMAWRLAAE